MPEDYYTVNKRMLQYLLSDFSQGHARPTRFVQRKSPLNGAVFVQSMVLGGMKKEVSLPRLAQISGTLGVPISAAGFDQRIDAEAVELLKRVFQETLRQAAGARSLDIALLARFSAVYLIDSTQVSLAPALAGDYPGSGGSASPAALKLQTLYELLSGTFTAIEVGAATVPDQTCRLHVEHSQPGALHLFDLGYFNQATLAELADRGAYFITRLEHQTGLFSDEQQPQRLQLLTLLRQLPGDRLEQTVQLGSKAHLPVRLLLVRLPQAEVEQRRRKAIAKHKAHGRMPTADYLELLAYQFFVTNVPADWLSFDHLLLLYRVRWQVELVFKLWKSQAGLAEIGPWRKARVEAQLYARLIGLTLFYHWSAPCRWQAGKELSLPKAFARLQEQIGAFLRAIRRGWRGVYALLKRLSAQWTTFDLKTHRRKHPSTLHQLLAAVP